MAYFICNSNVLNELCGIKSFTFEYFFVIKKMITRDNARIFPN